MRSNSKLMVIRRVPGLARYHVSACGRIFRETDVGQLVEMRQVLDREGYPRVRIATDKRRWKKVASIVAWTFFGARPDDKPEVRHLDGDKLNNHVNNLAYGTRRENVDDLIRHGGVLRGSAAARAKLTEAEVFAIRERTTAGEKRQALATEYGVSTWSIKSIVLRRSWKHVGPEVEHVS